MSTFIEDTNITTTISAEVSNLIFGVWFSGDTFAYREFKTKYSDFVRDKIDRTNVYLTVTVKKLSV